MFGGFSATKLKTQLKMAVSRVQIASNKKTALLKQNMREVAVLLAEEPPKEEMAGIKAEALIRDDHLLEALEIIQLECEMLHERIKLIDFSKTCPADLVSVVSTVIWASHRVDIPELVLVRKQFRAKYGKKFEENALTNKDNILNDRVVAKLSIQPPAAYLVQCYLERICEQFEVDWKPKVKLSASQLVEPLVAPSGYSVGSGQGTGLGPSVQQHAASAGTPDSTMMESMESTPMTSEIPLPPPTVPVATAQPYVPAAPTHPPGTTKPDDFEEVDIFVPPPAVVPPPAPNSNDSATLSTTHTNFSTSSNNTDEKKDENNNNMPPPAPGDASQGSVSTSYEDLAARFNNLKNI